MGQIFFLTRNVPFSIRFLRISQKNDLETKKMGVTHHLLGIWPQKHSRSSLQQLKTHFGVNSPLFQLKHPVLFSCNVINQLRNISRGKNVGAPYQKMGIWPLKGLQNSIFIQKVVKKTFVWPDSIKERCWESQKPVCKSFSLQYWRKLCFSVFWRCFMGQIPIIWWVTAIFFLWEDSSINLS